MSTTAPQDTMPTAFGPRDLRNFLVVLDSVKPYLPEALHDDLLQVTDRLGTVSASWSNATARSGEEEPPASVAALAAVAAAPPNSWTVADVQRVVADFDVLIGRMVTRHSNFGFAVTNNPSILDAQFPSAALTDLRLGSVRLGKLSHSVTSPS